MKKLNLSTTYNTTYLDNLKITTPDHVNAYPWNIYSDDAVGVATNAYTFTTTSTTSTTSTMEDGMKIKCKLLDELPDDFKDSFTFKKAIDIRPERIVKNGPATVVFWNDGEKTVVMRKNGEKDDPYYAFCAALAKRVYKTNSAIKKIIDMTVDETKKPRVKETNKKHKK